jgi:hypothetical protein
VANWTTPDASLPVAITQRRKKSIVREEAIVTSELAFVSICANQFEIISNKINLDLVQDVQLMLKLSN